MVLKVYSISTKNYEKQVIICHPPDPELFFMVGMYNNFRYRYYLPFATLHTTHDKGRFPRSGASSARYPYVS